MEVFVYKIVVIAESAFLKPREKVFGIVAFSYNIVCAALPWKIHRHCMLEFLFKTMVITSDFCLFLYKEKIYASIVQRQNDYWNLCFPLCLVLKHCLVVVALIFAAF